MRLIVIALVAIACGRIDYERQPCSWHRAGGPRLGAEKLRTDLSSPELDSDPLLVQGDALTMYVTSDKPGTNNDVFVTTRPSVDEPFGPLEPVFVTAANEYGVQLDADGHGYYITDAAGSPDIVELQRTANSIEIVRSLDEVNDVHRQLDVHPTRDGLSLWFAYSTPTTAQDLMIARRPSRDSPWTSIEPFVHNTPVSDAAATLSADELVVIWASSIAGSLDIYFATRAAKTASWGPPQLLGVSTAALELEPSLRDDACELFFARTPAPMDPRWDIYSVEIE